MIQIRKTSNVVSIRKGEGKGVDKSSSAENAPSPFALNAPDPLRSLRDRKSSPRTEDQHLAILQKALEPFADEARKRLPKDVSAVEKKVRARMLEHGFSNPIANEAGDEAVTALFNTRVDKKN